MSLIRGTNHLCSPQTGGVPRTRDFSAKSGTVSGKLGEVGHPKFNAKIQRMHVVLYSLGIFQTQVKAY